MAREDHRPLQSRRSDERVDVLDVALESSATAAPGVAASDARTVECAERDVTHVTAHARPGFGRNPEPVVREHDRPASAALDPETDVWLDGDALRDVPRRAGPAVRRAACNRGHTQSRAKELHRCRLIKAHPASS